MSIIGVTVKIGVVLTWTQSYLILDNQSFSLLLGKIKIKTIEAISGFYNVRHF